MIKEKKTKSKLVLPNGLRVVLQPKVDSKSVSIYLSVAAGPRYENANNSGLAHFLEHMLLEGTNRFPSAGELANYIESVGGRSSAWTDKEYVTYYVKVLPEHLQKGIDYLADIIFNSRLDEKEIEKEKGIVLEEINRKIDNPEVESFDMWMEWTWGREQSLGRSTLGIPDTIKKLTREKILNYMKQFYIPSNMVITIVGNFSEKDAEKWLKEYFNIQSKNKLPVFLPVRFVSKKEPIKYVESTIEQAQIICGFVTDINYFSKDRFALALLADILGGSVTSRLFYKLVYDLGIAYISGTYSWVFKDTALFINQTAVSSKNVSLALKTILEEFNKLKNHLISDEELISNKEKAKARIYFDMETTDAVANFYVTQLITENRIMTQEEIIAKIDSVSKEDIKRLANKCFNKENLSILVRGKFTDIKELKNFKI